MPKKTQLSLPYLLDKRLCVGHGVYGIVGYMVFSFDIQHDPVAISGKCIAFVYHILR